MPAVWDTNRENSGAPAPDPVIAAESKRELAFPGITGRKLDVNKFGGWSGKSEQIKAFSCS